jgi:hypothetical protein
LALSSGVGQHGQDQGQVDAHVDAERGAQDRLDHIEAEHRVDLGQQAQPDREQGRRQKHQELAAAQAVGDVAGSLADHD